MPNLAKVDYVERINRAIDHVTRHLAEPLSLDEVARVACFSPFHFHRIFRAQVGETLHAFIKRVRLERALFLMSHDHTMSLTDVALACGFSSSSDFSRSFRVEYGAPPSAFDVVALRATNRAQLAVAKAEPRAFDVTERDLPARRVAYVRVFAPYSGGVDTAAQRLIAWATERGLEGGQWLGYQWEDPELVPLDQCRYDVGLEVPRDVRIERDGEISVTEFPAMKVAEIEIAGPIEDEVSALEWLFAHWLPASGYVPDHQPCFEAWNGLPFAHGATHFELRVQLAVL